MRLHAELRHTRKNQALYAVCESGLTFRVGQPCTQGEADRRWARLDNHRVAGNTHTVRFDGRKHRVRWYEVRSVDVHGRGVGSERHALAFPVPFRAHSRGNQ